MSADAILGVHHVGLCVRDLARAAAFYSNAASFVDAAEFNAALTLVGTQSNPPANTRMLRGANSYLHLIEQQSQAPARVTRREVAEEGIVHLCLQSPRLGAMYDHFKTAGASFHAPPVDLGTGFLYSYARDLEGNVVELEGVPPVWEDARPWVAHVSFSSHDVDRLCAFYAGLLGSTPNRSGVVGPGRRIDLVSGMADTRFKAAWIPGPNMQVEVIQYVHPETVARDPHAAADTLGYQYVCFEVSNLTAAIAHAVSRGATPLGEPNTDDGVSTQSCRDPDGNMLLLMALAESQKHLGITALPDANIVARLDARRAELAAQRSDQPKQVMAS